MELFSGNRAAPKESFGFGLAARICHSVVNFSDSTGHLFHSALCFDVHKIDFRIIEEKMVVKRSDVKTILERS